jgi:DNA-binding NarL/FixJ family response regulator
MNDRRTSDDRRFELDQERQGVLERNLGDRSEASARSEYRPTDGTDRAVWSMDMGSRKRARILIADRERLFADALAVEVTEAGFDVVDVCETIGQAASRIAEGGVDLVLVDPEVDGGDDSTAYELLSDDPSVKLIVMSATLDYDRISRAVTLGYRGVVSKNARLARLIEALSSVESGDVTIETASPRGAEPPSRRSADDLIGRLTPREQQVLGFLVNAASGAEIAERLSVSPHTVRTHINNVMHKLGVHSRSEAVAFAVRSGLASPGGPPKPPSSSEVA